MSRFKRKTVPAPPKPQGGKGADSNLPPAIKKKPGPPPMLQLDRPVAEEDDDGPVPFELDSKRQPVGAVPGLLSVRAILTNLGSIQCTYAEVAAILGVDLATVKRFFRKSPEAKAVFEAGKESGKMSLRRHQLKLAERNATMGIFLGMQYLGQEDRRFMHMKGNLDVTLSPLGRLLKEIDEGGGGKVIEHDPAEAAPSQKTVKEISE